MIKILTSLILCFLFIVPAYGVLEIDETITIRILKTSSTKKTVLVNRGLEDGLVIDQHAKFYLTTGVIARGVVVKAAPSRSIWSIYRIIDGDQIVEDRVLNIKISTPLRLTEDPSKAIRVVPTTAAGSDTISTIPLADGANDVPGDLSDVDRGELESLGLDQTAILTHGGGFSQRDWEVWSLAHFNLLSGSYDQTDDTAGTTSQSNIDFSLGAEMYFSSTNQYLKNISLVGLIHSRSQSSGDAVTIKNSWLEYGGGVNYHFYGDHMRPQNLVLFGTLTFGIGSVNSEVTAQNSVGGDDSATTQVDGSSSFFSLGLGSKFYLGNGFGMRALLDYYRTNETYNFEEGEQLTRSLAGPRLQVGLSYRW